MKKQGILLSRLNSESKIKPDRAWPSFPKSSMGGTVLETSASPPVSPDLSAGSLPYESAGRGGYFLGSWGQRPEFPSTRRLGISEFRLEMKDDIHRTRLSRQREGYVNAIRHDYENKEPCCWYLLIALTPVAWSRTSFIHNTSFDLTCPMLEGKNPNESKVRRWRTA